MNSLFSVAGGITLTETSFLVLAILIMGMPFILLSIIGTAEVCIRVRKRFFGYDDADNITLPELLEQAAAKSTASTSTSASASTST